MLLNRRIEAEFKARDGNDTGATTTVSRRKGAADGWDGEGDAAQEGGTSREHQLGASLENVAGPVHGQYHAFAGLVRGQGRAAERGSMLIRDFRYGLKAFACLMISNLSNCCRIIEFKNVFYLY